MIPFLDLKKQYSEIKEDVQKQINKVLESCSFILGKETESFEKNFAEFCNKKYTVTVNSGTDALSLSLKALGIKQGDEVIIPANTFIATALAITNTGAKPVFVDIDEKTHNIDTEKIKEKINSNTKLIIPVHLYGQPADMDKIVEIAKQHNLKILEDSCQAHDSEYKGKKIPCTETGCYSFYPSKNLGAYGDGGAIVTDNEEIYQKLKKLRNYGETQKYYYSEKGANTRLDEIQAVVLNTKLKYLKDWTEKRRKLAKLYTDLLKDTVITPYESPDSKHNYYLYVIRTKQRDELKKFLESKEIYTGIHFPVPIHKQEAFKENNNESYPVTEQTSKEILSLPMFPELTEEQVKEVCEAIKEFLK